MSEMDQNQQSWLCRWENGKTLRFVPYDSYGMNSFLKQGLALGKVFINDRELISIDDGWKFKE